MVEPWKKLNFPGDLSVEILALGVQWNSLDSIWPSIQLVLYLNKKKQADLRRYNQAQLPVILNLQDVVSFKFREITPTPLKNIQAHVMKFYTIWNYISLNKNKIS